MSPATLLRHRLAHQQLAGSRFTEPAALVAWMGAMQAQEYAMVKWAIALRVPGATEARIEAALDAGQILRTHVLRPTWHLVAPQDIRWMLALTAPRVHAACAFGRKEFGLTPALLKRANAIITKALAGGTHLTRDEIAPLLRRARLPTAGIPLAHLFIHAELGGLICSGPRRGKQFTYALLDERVPATPALTRDTALATLARRYFASRGPATAADFAWWSGLTLTDARAGIAALGRGFVAEKIGGQIYYFPTPAIATAPTPLTSGGRNSKITTADEPPEDGARRSPSTPSTPATAQKLPAPVSFLMPDYDEYGIAYEDRAALFAAPGYTGKYREVHHAYNRMLVVDGRIVGSWKRTEKGPVVEIEIVPLAPLTAAAQKKIATAARRYAAYLGKEARLRCVNPRGEKRRSTFK
jgi:hypothetical protein